MMQPEQDYVEFVLESWKIEGLALAPAEADYFALYHERFMEEANVSAASISAAALMFTVGAGKLRDRPGMDVLVGGRCPPTGGPAIAAELEEICFNATGFWDLDPFETHQRFEQLHPFLDGNGRTGRLLWLWAMEREGKPWRGRGFLHVWYYQSLGAFKEA